jgi:hypothetical protein
MIYYKCCYVSTFNNFNTNLNYHYKTWKLKYGLHLQWLLLMWIHMCVKLRCTLLPWIPKATELCSRILSSKHSPCKTRHLSFQTKLFFQTPHFLIFCPFEKSSWWWVHKVEVHNTSLKELEATKLCLTSTCLLYIIYRPHEIFYGLGLASIKRKNKLGPFYCLPQHGLESLNIKTFKLSIFIWLHFQF